jgi:NAD(P)-dependent dehydrogenase (short-subunit alcohol dehydrogenase family)
MPDFMDTVQPQKGKVAIVTGSNTGLGFETAKALAGKGMKVIMACRDPDKAKKARQSILNVYPGADIGIILVDLAKLSSVHNFAKEFLSGYNRLDLLINNAGIMIPPYSLTEDGFESQIGVNYLSHFLLTGLLLKTLTKTPGSRIVMVSNIAHKKGYIHFDDLQWKKKYSPIKAYRQSKLACLVFAFELQRRLGKAGLKTISVSAHPGMSMTDLLRDFPKWLFIVGRPLISIFTHPPEKGALPILYAALASDVKGGEYFGPQGYQEWKGEPGRAYSTPLSHDAQLGKRLWDESERLTGIGYLSD